MAQNFCWLVAEAMRLVNCESFYLIFSNINLLSHTSFLRLATLAKRFLPFTTLVYLIILAFLPKHSLHVCYIMISHSNIQDYFPDTNYQS